MLLYLFALMVIILGVVYPITLENTMQEWIELKGDQVPIPSLKYSFKSHLREIVLVGGQLELADQLLLSF